MGGGGKGGSKAPKAPDYMSLAKEQGQQNMDIAKYLTGANRINQSSPFGSVSYSQGYSPEQNAQRQALQQQLEATYAPQNVNLPGYSQAAATAAKKQMDSIQAQMDAIQPQWNQQTTLSPELQQLLGANLSAQQNAYANLGNANLFQPGAYQDPRTGTGPTTGNVTETLKRLGLLNEDYGQYQAQGDKIRDALYGQLTQFNDERYGRAEDAERNRLAQMGLTEGTAAYQNALREFNRTKNEDYNTASLNATLAGGQEQSRILGDLLNTRASNIGLLSGQFGQGMQNAQLANALQQQLFGQNFSTNDQRYSQALTTQQQQQQDRFLPYQQLASLMGSQVQMPQFPQYNQATPFQGPDMLGAAQAGYNAQLGGYNTGVNQKGSLLGAGSGLLGSFLGGK